MYCNMKIEADSFNNWLVLSKTDKSDEGSKSEVDTGVVPLVAERFAGGSS